MSRPTIGIVDYGVGNLASVLQALYALDYRCRVSSDSEVLAQSDVLVLPGVGAFPAAMQALHARGLVDFVRQHAFEGKPVIGICLGMQLLADASAELGPTAGLGLIPGKVVALEQSRFHIGWNSIEVAGGDPLFMAGDGRAVYFNHSYVFQAPPEYQAAVARLDDLSQPFTVAVHRNNVVGMQFHPEKSQVVGRQLLASVIEGLRRA